jgi:hypothetical protein
VTIPIYNDGNNKVWGGIIGGRTNCNGDTCETADCGNGPNACKDGLGLSQPATQAEITMQKDVDWYDVEIINGVNIPISFGPTNVSPSGSYTCGRPGDIYPNTDVGACSWNFNPPSVDYNHVTAGGRGCNSNSDCGGQTCGISFNPGHSNLF